MEIMVNGRPVDSEEWLAWREHGMDVQDIARMLGVTTSRVEQLAKEFRNAGLSDPPFREPGPLFILDPGTDDGAYVLGILWGLLSVAEDGYWVGHEDKWYIDTVQEHLGVEGFASYSSSGGQWTLRINRPADVISLRQILDVQAWTPGNAMERPYPDGPLDDRGFIRAWFELHSKVDMVRTGRERKQTPRLRVTGEKNLLYDLKGVLSLWTGAPGRLQKTSADTQILYYHGSVFLGLLDWLYDGAALSNLGVRERLYAAFGGDK